MSQISAFRFQVNGRVQGVGFRAFVQRTAIQYTMNGWVKNHIDGSVIGEVTGEQGLVLDFLKAVKIGNRWSNVSSMIQEQIEGELEYKSFEIRY